MRGEVVGEVVGKAVSKRMKRARSRRSSDDATGLVLLVRRREEEK